MSGRLVVYTEAVKSGVGRYAVELANALADALQPLGVKVDFIGPSQDHVLRVDEVQTLETAGGRSRVEKLASLAAVALAGARRVAECCRPDTPLLMVHLAPTLPVSLAPLIAAKLRGAKTVLSLHDFYPHTLRFPKPLHGLERAIYRAAYRSFDLILTNTDSQAERLAKEAKVRPERIAPLYHGVFLIPDIRPPQGDDPVTLLVFGSLRPNKQVLETIQAVAALRAQGLDVRLRIAGAPRREDAEYWRRCREVLPVDDPAYDVQDRFIDEAELGDIFSRVDAFVSPYLGFDSQSGVAIAAASNGIPMIGTAVAAPPGLNDPGAAWTQIAPLADSAAIAEAVRAFLTTPRQTRQADARRAADLIQDRAGWPALARRSVEAMQKVEAWGAKPLRR